MEKSTAEELLGGFRIKVPLRAYLAGGPEYTLCQGKSATAIAIDRYTRAVVKVEDNSPPTTTTHNMTPGLTIVIWSGNEVILRHRVTSRSEVLNLTLEDPCEIKLVKHILRNDEKLYAKFKSVMQV